MRSASHEIDLPPIVSIEDDESEETQGSSSRQSPILAPLNVLQQTRGRGSITDPALHAASNNSSSKPVGYHHTRTEDLRANGEDAPNESDSSFDTPPAKRSSPSLGKKRKSTGESGNNSTPAQLVGRDGSAARGDGEAPAHKRRGSNTNTIPPTSHNRGTSTDTSAIRPSSPTQSPPNLPPPLPALNQPHWWGPPHGGYTVPPPPPGMHPYPWPQHPPPGVYVAFNPSNPHHHHHPPPPAPPPPSHLTMLHPASYGKPSDRSPSEPSTSTQPVASSSRRTGRTRTAKAESPAESTPTVEEAPPPIKHSTYTRSPELRISHKMAERKRRKAMKELFEDLQEHLPNDRGLKSSKWETLQRAIEHIESLRQRTEEMEKEISALKQELNMYRQTADLPPTNVPPPSLPPVRPPTTLPPQTGTSSPMDTTRPASGPKDAVEDSDSPSS